MRHVLIASFILAAAGCAGSSDGPAPMAPPPVADAVAIPFDDWSGFYLRRDGTEFLRIRHSPDELSGNFGTGGDFVLPLIDMAIRDREMTFAVNSGKRLWRFRAVRQPAVGLAVAIWPDLGSMVDELESRPAPRFTVIAPGSARDRAEAARQRREEFLKAAEVADMGVFMRLPPGAAGGKWMMDAASSLMATLEDLRGRLDALLARGTPQASYSTREFAERVGLSDWTVRNYCRLGRLCASKKRSGRGAHPEWVLSHEELERYRKEGLLDA